MSEAETKIKGIFIAGNHLASLLEGSYVGEIVMLDGCYGVQLVGGRAIVHDLSVVKLPQPLASVIEVRYDRGVATICS